MLLQTGKVEAKHAPHVCGKESDAQLPAYVVDAEQLIVACADYDNNIELAKVIRGLILQWFSVSGYVHHGVKSASTRQRCFRSVAAQRFAWGQKLGAEIFFGNQLVIMQLH